MRTMMMPLNRAEAFDKKCQHNISTSNEIESPVSFLRVGLFVVCDRNSRRWYIRFVYLLTFMMFETPKKAVIGRKILLFLLCLFASYKLLLCSALLLDKYKQTNHTRDFNRCSCTIEAPPPHLAISVYFPEQKTTLIDSFTSCCVGMGTNNRALFTIWFVFCYFFFSCLVHSAPRCLVFCALSHGHKPKSTQSILATVTIASDLFAFLLKWLEQSIGRVGSARLGVENQQNIEK